MPGSRAVSLQFDVQQRVLSWQGRRIGRAVRRASRAQEQPREAVQSRGLFPTEGRQWESTPVLLKETIYRQSMTLSASAYL